MGMIQSYLRLDNDTLNAFIEDSSLREAMVYSDDIINNVNFLDLDKAWEAVFFIITGQCLADAVVEEAPLLGILMGPTEIDSNQDIEIHGISPIGPISNL